MMNTLSAQTARVFLVKLLPCAPSAWTWKGVAHDLAMALLLGLLGLLAMANVVVVGELVFPGSDPLVVDTGYDFRSQEEFREANDYHGLDGIVATWNKKKMRWEFQRDGKPCPLFAYLEQKGR